MRILIISNKSPFPARDGGAVATLGMLRGLVAAGNRVNLITFSTSKHPFEGDPEATAKQEKVGLHLVPLDTGIRYASLLGNLFFSVLPYNLARFRSSRMREYISSHLKENSYDIVQIEGLAMCLYLDLIKRNHTGKLSLRAHNVENEIWSFQARQERNPVKSFYAALIGRRTKRFEAGILKNIDILIPISPDDAGIFAEMGYRGPLKTIPAGMAEATGIQKAASGSAVVYIGSLDWRPNQDGLRWFIRHVWASVKEEVPDARFLIAGRNAPGTFLKELSGPGIEFRGEAGDSRQFLSAGQVQVVPLFCGSGIRIKILEGMSLGKAIVSSATGCKGIPVTHGVNILVADDPEQFALETVKLLRNPSLREELGRKAVDFVRKNFDNLALSAELTRFYRENTV